MISKPSLLCLIIAQLTLFASRFIEPHWHEAGACTAPRRNSWTCLRSRRSPTSTLAGWAKTKQCYVHTHYTACCIFVKLKNLSDITRLHFSHNFNSLWRYKITLALVQNFNYEGINLASVQNFNSEVIVLAFVQHFNSDSIMLGFVQNFNSDSMYHAWFVAKLQLWRYKAYFCAKLGTMMLVFLCQTLQLWRYDACFYLWKTSTLKASCSRLCKTSTLKVSRLNVCKTSTLKASRLLWCKNKKYNSGGATRLRKICKTSNSGSDLGPSIRRALFVRQVKWRHGKGLLQVSCCMPCHTGTFAFTVGRRGNVFRTTVIVLRTAVG